MQDLSIFNFEHLQRLALDYNNIIEGHRNSILKKEKESNPNLESIKQLKLSLKYFEQELILIVDQINLLVNEKLRVSIEELFIYFGEQKKFIQIFFVTTSTAYSNYGSCVSGHIRYMEGEEDKIRLNIESQIRTDGVVYFDDVVSQLTDRKRADLKNIGFLASDISHYFTYFS